MSGGRRKFTIGPYRSTQGLDKRAAEETWAKLQMAIRKIQEKNSGKLSFEELYRFAYNLVLHKHGDMLYVGVMKEIQRYLTQQLEAILRATDEQLLVRIAEVWEDHLLVMRMIADILMYLDRNYAAHAKRPTIKNLGNMLFQRTLIGDKRVHPRLQAQLLDNIARSRRNEVVDRSLMRTTIAMLVRLGHQLYSIAFEQPFLVDTSAFYRKESLDFLAQGTCPDYLAKAEARLAEERQRLSDYLAASTAMELMRTVEVRLIADHAPTLIEMSTGAIEMMDKGQVQPLRSLYRLFARVVHDRYKVRWRPPRFDSAGTASASASAAASGGAHPGAGAADEEEAEELTVTPMVMLRMTMERLIEARGRALVLDTQQSKDPVSFVTRLLGLRQHFAAIVDSSFGGHKEFQTTMRVAFERFVNIDVRCAQFLSMFLDYQMRVGFRGADMATMEERLDDCITVFRFIRDKDVFESFYKRFLQQRLLNKASVSSDAELSLISKLKTECGVQYTHKLEGMFNDLRVSEEVAQEFRRARTSGNDRTLAKPASQEALAPFQLEPTILTTVNWVVNDAGSARVVLPRAVAAAADVFAAWYLDRHSGRRLEWQPHLGHAEVRCLHTARRYELHVSSYQLCILMCYNQKTEWTVNELELATRIPEAQLKRHLVSLATPLARVFVKKRRGKEILPSDVFALNPNYRSPKLRVRVKLVTLRSVMANQVASATRNEVPAQVEQERRLQVEAAIVRIMKTRKTLEHQQLIAETIRQLQSRFRPQPMYIKKRIENLIDRDYMERDEKNRKLYHYVA